MQTQLRTVIQQLDTALGANTTGASLVAVGANALLRIPKGANNTALGMNALHDTLSGAGNTAVGSSAGYFISTGAEQHAGWLQRLLGVTTNNYSNNVLM